MNEPTLLWVTNDQSVLVVNCTPHPIRFQTAMGIVQVPESGYTLAAEPIEKTVSTNGAVQYVKTVFAATTKGYLEIESIYSLVDEPVLIVGSIISAQAYPGDVVSLVPVPGSERAKPADKLYRCDKWNVF